ncbi:MAG: GntR family transcriptional regulator [Rhizobiales bacterium]|nr:GntR family transcriptional regulator [Hyphomicrobiales bacterium]
MFKRMPDVQPRLADDVYEQILSAIVNGQIAPGDRLIQEKIAAEINISRTPVREALLRLEREGILELSGRKGFSIRQISEEEVRDIYGVREAIEGYGAYWVAANRTDERIEAIAEKVAEERALKEHDMQAEFRINRDIHRTIVAQTGNKALLDMFDSIWGRGISQWLFAATRTNQMPPDPDVHDKLLSVIKNGSPAEAQAAMIEHVRDGLNMQIKGLKE